MPHGQIVLGAPGSGKTTYCHALQQLCHATGRKVALVNLDPANERLPYSAAVELADLVHLEAVMEELKLGPNGGLIYCIDYLEKNIDWLREKLEPLEKEGYYFVFDLPGQVELFMMHDNLKRILGILEGQWHYRLTAVSLVDAHLCTDPSKYVSALLLSLNTMLHLEMPHINVLSKVDLLRQYGKLDFKLDFYTEVQDLSYLLKTMASKGPFSKKYRKLTEGLCSVIEDFGLVRFVPLAVTDRESLAHILGLADKANGYVFVPRRGALIPPEMMYGSTVRGDEGDLVGNYQEKYIDRLPPLDIKERQVEGGTLPGPGSITDPQ